MAKGEFIRRSEYRQFLNHPEIHLLGQAVLGMVLDPTVPPYEQIAHDLHLGLSGNVIVNYLRRVRLLHLPDAAVSEPTAPSTMLSQANERYIAGIFLEQIGMDEQSARVINPKNTALLHIITQIEQSKMEMRQEYDIDRVRGTNKKAAETGRMHVQDLSEVLRIMWNDFLSVYKLPQEDRRRAVIKAEILKFQKQSQPLKHIPSWLEDTVNQIRGLGNSPSDVVERVRLTKLANVLRTVGTQDPLALSMISAVKKVAWRKMEAQRLGRSVQDTYRLKQEAALLTRMTSQRDIDSFINATFSNLPNSWKNEIYLEMLPFFKLLYSNTHLFSPIDVAFLEDFTRYDEQQNRFVYGLRELSDRGVERLRGSAVEMVKDLLIHGAISARTASTLT